MKLAFSILAAPLLLGMLIVGGLFAWNALLPQYSLTIMQMLAAGAIAFCLSIALYTHIMMSIQATRWRRVSDGIRRYEREVAKRFEDVSSQMGTRGDIDKIKGKLRTIKHQVADIKSSFSYPIEPELLSRKEHSQIHSEDGKIIALKPGTSSASSGFEEEKRFRIPSDMAGLINEGRLIIFLQPSVFLQKRSVHGYEVLARLELSNGRIAPASVFLEKLIGAGLMPKADRLILEQTVALLRALKRRNESPKVYWHISRETLNSKSAFRAIMDLLTANSLFKRNLIVELSPAMFESLGKKQKARLQEIREAGFCLSLDNCSELRGTVKIITGGLFNTIKVPVNVVERAVREGFLGTLQEICKRKRISMIATHVEREHEVIHLIDENIMIGQGYLFSEPKKPSLGEDQGESVA